MRREEKMIVGVGSKEWGVVSGEPKLPTRYCLVRAIFAPAERYKVRLRQGAYRS